MPDNLYIDAPHTVYWMEHTQESPDKYWRFNSFVDFESPFQSRPIANIKIGMWTVLRHTPKGVWIAPPFSNKWNEEKLKRLVIHDTKKKYAYPTKAEAWESYCIRQMRRNQHHQIEGERLSVLNTLLESEKERLAAAQ